MDSDMQNRVWQHHSLTKSQAIVLTIMLAIVAIGTPIFFSMQQAQKQGMDAAKNRAFIPMAEKSGIIRNITRYVLDTLAEEAQGLFNK